MNEFLSKIGKGLLSSPSFTTTYEKERFLQQSNIALLTFFLSLLLSKSAKGNIIFHTEKYIKGSHSKHKKSTNKTYFYALQVIYFLSLHRHHYLSSKIMASFLFAPLKKSLVTFDFHFLL